MHVLASVLKFDILQNKNKNLFVACVVIFVTHTQDRERVIKIYVYQLNF